MSGLSAGSALTLGELLKHLALCEELKFQSGLFGAPLLPEFRDVDHDSTWETWAWESAKDDDLEALRDLWLRAVHRSRAAIASALAESGLDYAPEGGMSLRRLISDTLEEYARHTRQADLLREAVDGATGEGPPGEFPVPWSRLSVEVGESLTRTGWGPQSVIGRRPSTPAPKGPVGVRLDDQSRESDIRSQQVCTYAQSWRSRATRRDGSAG